jgi:uncharacterized protein (DUF1330 family)
MSVLVTLRVDADPRRLEEYAAAHADAMRSIADRAVERGLIAHRFYGSDQGRIMVVDEWPDAESFQRFFEAERTEIESMLAAVGVGSEPALEFWRRLETHDAVGWGA